MSRLGDRIWCFTYLQNNKALKPSFPALLVFSRFTYLQNNKALKP